MAKGKFDRWLEPDGLLLLEAWARDGLSDEQIAHNMGINVATLYRYKDKFDEIREALKKGKEVADIQVENALYKRAMGYRYTETVKERVQNPQTKEYELVVVKEIEKEMPPDTASQIFWLRNRRTDKWKNTPEATQETQAAPKTINVVFANNRAEKKEDKEE